MCDTWVCVGLHACVYVMCNCYIVSIRYGVGG